MATIDNVSLDIAVVLGTTMMPVHQVLRLGRGAIIELDAGEDDEVKILANNLPVARGTVVVSGNRIAVEVKDTAAARARRALRPGRRASRFNSSSNRFSASFRKPRSGCPEIHDPCAR